VLHEQEAEIGCRVAGGGDGQKHGKKLSILRISLRSTRPSLSLQLRSAPGRSMISARLPSSKSRQLLDRRTSTVTEIISSTSLLLRPMGKPHARFKK
jgi:hypothetical protein